MKKSVHFCLKSHITGEMDCFSFSGRYTSVKNLQACDDRYVSTVANQFAGQLCWVTLTEDPTLYAIGTLEAAPSYDPITGKGQLVLSCTDGDAFLYYVSETVESITGSGTVTIHNDFMPVVPVITTTAETTLRWAVDGESFHKTVSVGTWEIPELEFRYGVNTVSVRRLFIGRGGYRPFAVGSESRLVLSDCLEMI